MQGEGVRSHGFMRTFWTISFGLVLSMLDTGRSFADSASAVAPSVLISADSVRAGRPAPDFKLLSQDGKEIRLSDFYGKWVVLYFYPKDFTEGCTIEAHNFQRDIQKYRDANAVLLGISVNSVISHNDFCTKEALDFKLLADTAAEVSTRYGSVHDWYGRTLSARNTFIINPYGIVARVFIGVQPGTHSAEVLAALKELQK